MPEYHFCPHYEAVHHNAAPESGSLLFHRLFPVRHKLLISLSEKIIAPLYFYVSLIRFDYILSSVIAVLVLSFRAVDLISDYFHQLFLFQIIIIYSCQHRHRLFDKFLYLLSPFSGNDIFFRRSFKVISAARKTRLSLYPLTIPARVFILHGITIIPIVR